MHNKHIKTQKIFKKKIYDSFTRRMSAWNFCKIPQSWKVNLTFEPMQELKIQPKYRVHIQGDIGNKEAHNTAICSSLTVPIIFNWHFVIQVDNIWTKQQRSSLDVFMGEYSCLKLLFCVWSNFLKSCVYPVQ